MKCPSCLIACENAFSSVGAHLNITLNNVMATVGFSGSQECSPET